ncbi:hypothetical protein HGI16_02115 [Brevibacterium casei]|uniref:5-formyltetrahydrofolate cyclo-ligase n=1 Tax=Brevibacterium casei TaxID=33889 RepID=A0AB34XX55_9MICO|nr:5-formyltetrahydrofolate cyclo-ligase [Brevibacterium casei]KZE23431.1 hypothetical protein AVW13_04265 [Brevibacterium casei]MBE4693514.1 hypothetical protein [Brevibacterium casei]MBY3576637.1 hypothetical protein [Brevibacterium casei]QQT70535.1 hypothetical protein I6I57_06600 [Brevibacterium casei]QZE25271.1 hypothetical protein K4X33_14635 [Brevibacterium casei]
MTFIIVMTVSPVTLKGVDRESSKAQLRARIRAQRSARSRAVAVSPPPAEATAASRTPARAALAWLAEIWPSHDLTGRVVVAYAALPGEPDVDAVVDGIRARGARVFLPVVTRVGRALEFGEVTGPMSDLTPHGRWGIREPHASLSASALIAEAAPDLLFVPALGFGAGGARLGNGGGFYDRTFGPFGEVPLGRRCDTAVPSAAGEPATGGRDPDDQEAGPRVVGVCFAEEVDLSGLAVEPWDLRIPEAITEDGLRRL